MKNYKPDWFFHLLFKLVKSAFVSVLLLFFYKCATTLYIPAVLDAKKAGIDPDTLRKGREIYVSHCGACHNLYIPEKFTSGEWEKYVDKMQQKAKINDTQKGLILKYVNVKSSK